MQTVPGQSVIKALTTPTRKLFTSGEADDAYFSQVQTRIHGSTVEHQSSFGKFEDEYLKKEIALQMAAGRYLREGDAVVPAFTLEPRIAGILPGFDASEEGLEGKFDTHRDVLENLRMNALELGMLLFPAAQVGYLVIHRERSRLRLINSRTLVDQTVVDLSAQIERLVQRRFLRL